MLLVGQFGLNAIPPTYTPPRPPHAGKPLTNRQKLALVVTILVINHSIRVVSVACSTSSLAAGPTVRAFYVASGPGGLLPCHRDEAKCAD